MKCVALLTGRGNNTLKDKNVLPVLGLPLASYPARAAKKVSHISAFYVSSDDDKILQAVAAEGYKKIVRPKELATPTAKHIDTLFHALNYMKENDNIVPDILVVLLANSATVKSEWIADAIDVIVADNSISSVVPVYREQDHHPYRAKRIGADGYLEPFFDFSGKTISTNRQELEPCYFLSHNFWVLNVKRSIYGEGGQQPWTFLGYRTLPIIVDESIDIHCEEDIVRTEKWVRENL
jgi:CMP-N,N'-diacetyllegionaminic acid synthase